MGGGLGFARGRCIGGLTRFLQHVGDFVMPHTESELHGRVEAAAGAATQRRSDLRPEEVDEVRIVAAWIAEHEPPALALESAREQGILRRFLASSAGWFRVVEERGQAAVQSVYQAMLEGRADPAVGHVLAL